MNIVSCKENCRWQNDGLCTLCDLTRPTVSTDSQCRYFERADDSTDKA